MKIICEQSVECPDESYWSYAYDSGHLCVCEGGGDQRNSSRGVGEEETGWRKLLVSTVDTWQ